MNPLPSSGYVVPKAELFFMKAGTNNLINLGDADDVNIEIAVEEQERYANNIGVRTLVKSTVIETTCTINLTLAQMSAFARAASMMASTDTMSQDAATASTHTITGPVLGGIYKVGKLKLSNVSIVDSTDPTPVALVLGTDYIIDLDAGLIELLTDGHTGNLTVTYDAAAITSGHKNGIANNPTLRGEMTIRGVNLDGDKVYAELWDVELRPASARAFISETDFATIELTGKLYRVAGKPAGYEFGQEQTL